MSELPAVLICDDEPVIVAALSRAVRQAGLDPIPLTAGDQILDAAIRMQPALIVLDVHQVVDGRRLLAALKSDTLTRDIKVVMISGDWNTQVQSTCMQLGADHYELKPFGIDFLDRLVEMATGAAGRLGG